MALDNLTWEGNSKEMYDKVISFAPWPMQEMAKKEFKGWVEKKNITTMTEDLLEEHIKETAPSPFVGMLLEQIQPLKTK